MKTYQQLDSFSTWTDSEKDDFTINVIKGLIMDGVRHANSGHTGGPMSSADFATILFKDFLQFDPNNPDWVNRDRFVLSAGHESMLIYSLLYQVGWLSMDDLKAFRQLHSRTPGHPEVEIPGVEATTGPLGQGIGMGVGMAVAEAILKAQLSELAPEASELMNHFTYILCGDGDIQEPVALGSAALAGHWGLSNLIMYYDCNKIQITGDTAKSDSTDIAAMFCSLKWNVVEIDGHDHNAIRKSILHAQNESGPSLIIGHTTMAKGSAGMEGSADTHGSPMPQEEIDSTKEKLGLPTEPFYAPEIVKNHFQMRFSDLKKTVNGWDHRFKGIEDEAFHAYWDKVIHGYMDDLEYPVFDGIDSLSTRKAFGTALEKFSEQLPTMVGGSADLDPSNCTAGFAKRYGDFSRENPGGRNLSFGVREFPMGAIMNGLALHGGIIPFGGTFLVFADYSRPAIRLAALQKIRAIHEFTHDSFYVGEDGPTHQPVEHAMALRAIPNLNVFRPADAKEAVTCFHLAIDSGRTPSAILLTRQNVPILELEMEQIREGVLQGAYCVRDCDGPPEIVLIATGSEVSLAMDVARNMSDKNCRVVSMPSMELFDDQPNDYRENLIPQRGCLRVSIEAGVTMGWDKHVGPNGLTIGLDRFGASAPGKDLAEYFGFTPESVEEKIRAHIAGLL